MTSSSTRTPALAGDEQRPAVVTEQAQAIVVWRGERIAFRDLPERIARTEEREERDRLFGAYLEALDALNPRWEDRLERRRSSSASDATLGVDPSAFVKDLEGFILHTETPYYAALRRYLALIDIEQGDATVADVWHIARGGAWAHWFGERSTRQAIAASGRAPGDPGGSTGWLAAERMLRGDGTGGIGSDVAGVTWATLIGSPEWLEAELGVAPDDVVPFVDFVAFVRLWRLRRAIAELQYELRLTDAADPALARAYYGGISGHMIGVLTPEQMYLVVLGDGAPYASVRELAVEILASSLVATLESRHGATWWRGDAARELVDAVAGSASVEDALAQLGYDALDWRPVLRQIRTRLIGEMSGYGGPNITTRAGTRKV